MTNKWGKFCKRCTCNKWSLGLKFKYPKCGFERSMVNEKYLIKKNILMPGIKAPNKLKYQK